MERDRRKRKLENEEEENEEQKMEKFLALIRSTKDVRERLSKGKEDKKDDEEKAKGWNPTFKPEDFIDFEGLVWTPFPNPAASSSAKEVVEKAPPADATPPQNQDKEKASDNLDLTLSL